jgi:hypothetical protein
MLVKSEWHALWAAWGQRGRVASNTMGVVSELRTHNAGDQPSTNPHTCSGWTETPLCLYQCPQACGLPTALPEG